MGALTDDKDALTLKDVWSDLKHCYPMPNKSYEEAYDAIQHFSNGRPVKLWYSDGSGELEKAVRHLAIPYDRSAAGVSQNNAIAERNNRDILEGTRVALVRAGTPCGFWPFASQVYCLHENFHPREDGYSPYFLTHNAEFTGMRIPFGASVI